ncbi:MAG: ribosome recycling factor [Chromatiales bacterium]|nr:ribosome recycling factor [Chromatiales bacterium]MDP6150675.1 ribosome recycling factor [Gammaproteobacteria bacterium]MDP7270795.1 ribosome recycling factor [Gammaproteobacteria bacterium]HJP03719.1 ribosome recycling factor [Gammaproteobacteria bacterium]
MIEDLKKDADQRMQKSVGAFSHMLTKLRTGRAQTSLLEQIMVDYYGAETPLSQVANIAVEDSRTLSVTPWEQSMIPGIEKAIQNCELGLNPVTAGKVIRVPLPDLTEERRQGLARMVKQEAEQGKVAVRNVRRDVMGDIKTLLKEKEISEDEERRAEQDIQQITDKYIHEVEKVSEQKQKEIMDF